MAEQFVWQEEFERAAAEAEAMRTDAAKRNNLDAAAQALDSAFAGGKFFRWQKCEKVGRAYIEWVNILICSPLDYVPLIKKPT